VESTFRASMSWLHTWAGVVLGGLLFAIFWTGTLAVFDREIDRWMASMTRLSWTATSRVSIDALRPLYEKAAAARAPDWRIGFPTGREPAIRVGWRDGAAFVQHFVDPSTNTVLPDPGTLGGTGFFYPFHYMLHVRTLNIGLWIVGLAAMAMLALCVSGVVVHRKIFTDFFTFRAGRKPRRLVLDLHNVTGVLGLPFHVAITLSGVVIIFSTYFPTVWQIAYRGDPQAFFADAYGANRPARTGRPGATASFDAMIDQARGLWGGGPARTLRVRNPGDAGAVVQVSRLDEGSASSSHDLAHFQAATGAPIGHHVGTPAVMGVQRFLAGLHLIQFRHWALRWAYFLLGLAGCVVIASGYLFWLESRRKKHAQLGLSGVRVVDGLTIGSVTGIVIATLAFFVVNRLLPLGMSFLGQGRAALEVWTFYLVWVASLGHAWLRPHRAWQEQCWAVAALAVAAMLLNWLTTGDHLVHSLTHRHLWAIAGMDLVLLAGAAIAVFGALRVRAAATRVRGTVGSTASPA